MWLPLLFACAEPDPSATGARWDTATDPRPTLVGTLSVVDTLTTVPIETGVVDWGLCLGDGQAEVEVGTGGLLGFESYVDGDDLPLLEGVNGKWGFLLDVRSSGLDTSYDVNAILRVGFRGNTSYVALSEEYLAKVVLQCPHPGPAWVQVFAPLPEEMQVGAPQGLLDGMEVELALSLVDRGRKEDTVFVDMSFTR